jgi:aspartate aminotransferase-like enzyme
MMKRRLYTPGPTPIPPDAVVAMAQPIDYHRGADASELFRRCADRLKTVLATDSDVAILTSSGTGAMEAAVVNLLSAGDSVVVIESGKFGERWGEIADAYGLTAARISVEWGDSVDPAALERALRGHPDARAVFATLCETSTGALHDVRSLASITKSRDTLLIVDAVSALGADEIRMDAWGVDAVVSCSQKGLMTPPGLAFLAFGPRATEASRSAKLPKFYFDHAKYVASLANDTTPYTPAISLLYGLDAALAGMAREGMDAIYARHARMARATREGVKATGLAVFASSPANTLTSIRLPESFDGKELQRRLRDDHGMVFAGGQGRLAGRIVRIAHLGWMDEYDALTAVAALERGLADMGHDVSVGKGVQATQEALAE